jgi:arabinofuranan 3-O-arabinosyltransferase
VTPQSRVQHHPGTPGRQKGQSVSATEAIAATQAASRSARPARPGVAGPPRPRLRRWLAGSGSDPLGGGWLVGLWALAFTGLLLQAPGRIVFDTKIDINLTPEKFLTGITQLWHPELSFGSLQNQAVGYAFPMGPFYLVAEGIGLPVWITERLWMSLIVAVAFWGAVRLAERLGVGGPVSRLTSGLAYALWPVLTSLLGSTSAAVLPMALLPWTIVPLIAGARSGAPPLVCAARSAATVLCMGGVNAVSVLAVLPAPFLYLLTRTSGTRRRALLFWWPVSVLLVTAWYWLPLLLLGSYGFNFLPYIETPHATSSTMAATEALRGTGNWIGYLNLGAPSLPAAWVLVAVGWAVAGTACTAALGLGGLARRGMPETQWLRLTLCAGAAGTMAVYPGSLGGPFHEALQSFMDGPASAFHSIYKFQPLIALPLVLGLAHTLGSPPRLPTRTAWLLRGGLAVALSAALLGAALPYLTGRVLQSGSFKDVPGYWKQTADFLAGNGGEGRALLEPASAHGNYAWGTTTDDVLQPLAESNWAARTLVPQGGAGSQRYLDAAEKAMESGTEVPGLARYLARAGVRYVVVRHDLDPDRFDFVSPAAYHRTLQLSGFTRVARFGPVIPASPVRSGTPLQIQAVDFGYRAVEIYQTADPRLRSEEPVSVLPADGATQLSGGPESLLQLSANRLLDGRATMLTGDGRTSGNGPRIVTDGLRRTDTSFGLIRNGTSYTYTARGTNPPGRRDGSAGEPPRQLLPFAPAGHQTTAVLAGAKSVTASTYGSWLLQSPEYDPVNAFDGDPGTAWAEGDARTPVGQWLDIGFGRAVDVAAKGLTVRLLADTPSRPVATGITVTTDRGSVTTRVTPNSQRQSLRVPPGPTHRLRLTITAAKGAAPGGLGAGISEVTVPGVKVTRYLDAPDDARTGEAGAVYDFHRETAASGLLRTGDPETSLARGFVLDKGDAFTASLSAVPVPGPALDKLLDATGPKSKGLTATASRGLDGLPRYRAANLVDGSYLSGWIAGTDHPSVTLKWRGARTLKELYLKSAEGASAAPRSVRITSPDGNRTGRVERGGHIRFDTLRTNRVTLTFPKVQRITTPDSLTGARLPLPLGLSEVRFPALTSLQNSPLDSARKFRLPCGRGPDVTIDGARHPTSASGTVGDLVDGLPVRLSLCGSGKRVGLEAGRHRVFSPGSGNPLAVTDLRLTGSAAADSLRATAPGRAPARKVTGTEWGPENRTVMVGNGFRAYLEVHENAAPGWSATLNGKRLRAVTLDGWQQGFVIPAGQSGAVHITYGPAALHRSALAAGALLALLVVLVAVGAAGGRRGAAARDAPAAVLPGVLLPAVGVATLLLVGGWMAWASVLLAVAARLWPAVAPAIAVTGMTAAGIIAAAAAEDGLAPDRGAFGPWAQALALIALAAAVPGPGGGWARHRAWWGGWPRTPAPDRRPGAKAARPRPAPPAREAASAAPGGSGGERTPGARSAKPGAADRTGAPRHAGPGGAHCAARRGEAAT